MALQENRNIRRITIVGGGTSGYLAAFYLSKNYPEKEITWIFPEENNPIGVGEALVPKSSDFLLSIGISHKDILKYCNGTLKLGILFDGFNKKGENFFFPFGIGVDDKHNGSSINYIMQKDLIPDTILEYRDMATHFNTVEFAKYLDKRTHEFDNLKILRNTVNLTELEGTYDLLIDSTGFKRHMSKQPDNFEDISHIIPNNRALTCRIKYTDKSKQCLPYSLFKAMDYGWCWHIPLGDKLSFGYVHDNKFDVREEFISHVKDYMGIDPIEINVVNFITGRNKVHLKDNIVSIGLASTFVEPIESTGIYLIISAIERLKLYIDGEITEHEYNLQTNETFDGIVNFIAAHYKYSKRDNEYWNHYKNLKIENYKETRLFPVEAWRYVLSGFGLNEYPKESMDPREFINIQKGTSYVKWLESIRNEP
jgi:tryptophan halogenase